MTYRAPGLATLAVLGLLRCCLTCLSICVETLATIGTSAAVTLTHLWKLAACQQAHSCSAARRGGYEQAYDL